MYDKFFYKFNILILIGSIISVAYISYLKNQETSKLEILESKLKHNDSLYEFKINEYDKKYLKRRDSLISIKDELESKLFKK